MRGRTAAPSVRSQAPLLATARAVSPAVWGALAIVYVVWGSTYLAIREAIRTIPPFLMASTRFLVAGGFLYLVAVRRGDREADRPGAAQWRAAAIVGGLLLLGGNGGVVWAEQHIPSGTTALLVATVPLWMVVIGRVAFRERVRPQEMLGVLIGFGGVALLVVGSGTRSGRLNMAGVAAALVAPVSWALGSLYSRRAELPSRPLVSTAMQMLAGGVLLGIAGLVTGEVADVDPSRISLGSVVGLVYLIALGSLVAFSAYVWLLRNAPISLVGTYAYVNPVVAVFLGWAFLDEVIRGTTLLAGAVIVVAVALIVTAHRPAPAPSASGRVRANEKGPGELARTEPSTSSDAV